MNTDGQDYNRDAGPDRSSRYESAYLADYGFESVMVHYRQRLLLECLNKWHPSTVLEIGCGSELLYEAWINVGGRAKCWVTVEPASRFSELAAGSGLPNLHVLSGYFERLLPAVKLLLPSGPDLVICSGVLHEVESPSGMLSAIMSIMGNHSLLHVNVPNSESLHRRLAKSMGLILDTKAVSDRNTRLSQHRVYDSSTLEHELSRADLQILDFGDFFLKPFTHSQMEEIRCIVGDSVLDGLYKLGRELPELASEIYVEARKKQQ